MSSPVPFCWQDKRVLRRIRQECDNYHSALAVYQALTVVASDSASEEFRTTHKWLAQLSGFSERTVRSRVSDLEHIGVIEVTTPALKVPSTYRLLPFGNGCPTFGNGCRAIGNGSPPTVAAIRRTEEPKRKRAHFRQLGTAERIGLENQWKALKKKRDDLEADLADLVARETEPEKVRELDQTKTRIAGLERSLDYV